MKTQEMHKQYRGLTRQRAGLYLELFVLAVTIFAGLVAVIVTDAFLIPFIQGLATAYLGLCLRSCIFDIQKIDAELDYIEIERRRRIHGDAKS